MQVYDGDPPIDVEQSGRFPGDGGGYRGAHRDPERSAGPVADIPVLSEEESAQSWDIRQHWQRYWLVDPLDGTKEFIKRNREFTVTLIH
ncbi:inositol monophosphatase family protein [Shigella flexneri]